MIYAPLVLVAVLVSARSSAEWSKSNSTVDQRTPVDAKQKLRAHKESDEERVGPSPHLDPQLLPSFTRNEESSATPLTPILKSSIPSLTHDKSVAEPLSSNVPHKDASRLKNNIELTQRMEELGINLDDVVTAVQTLQTTGVFLKHKFSEYSLTLMALGSVYFKNFESSSAEIKPIELRQLKSAMVEYVDSPEFNRWIDNHPVSPVSIEKVYGKMRWLVKSGGFKKCDKQDLADMAYGSEYFKVKKIDLSLLLPKSETLDLLKHRIQYLINQDDVDPKVKHKLRAFAEDPDFFKYNVEELRRRAKVAVLEDELTHFKSNKAFTQRMKTLGINIDDVIVDVQMLRTNGDHPKYTDYQLALMILGSKYFERIKDSSSEIEVVNEDALVQFKTGYVNSKEFKDWREHRRTSRVAMKNVNKKMLWLMEHEDLKIKNEELADMAYGSEYFRQKKINLDEERPEYLIKLLKERGGVRTEDIDMLENKMKQDPESVIGKNAGPFERKVKHLLLGADLEEETHKRRKVA